MIKFEDLASKLVVWNSKVFVTRNLLLHNDLFTFGSKLFPRLISLIKICCSECQFIIKLCTAYTDCGCGCTKSIINLWFAKTVINIWSHRYFDGNGMQTTTDRDSKMEILISSWDKSEPQTGWVCQLIIKEEQISNDELFLGRKKYWKNSHPLGKLSRRSRYLPSTPQCKIYFTKQGRGKTIAINGLYISTWN